MSAARQVRWRLYGIFAAASFCVGVFLSGCNARPTATKESPEAREREEASRAPASIDTEKQSTAQPSGVAGSVIGPPPRIPHSPAKRRKSSARPQPVPPKTPEQKLEEAVSHLKVGGLAYSFPEKMKTGQRDDVVASIGSDKVPIAVLKAKVQTDDEQEVKTEQTPITPKMKMTLTSADFEITPQSSDEQLVAGNTPTTWRWTIAPKHSGKLHLHLAAIIELEDLKQDFTTVDHDVAVQVDPMDEAEKFVQNNWQWMLSGTGGVAVVGGIWKLFKRKKDPGEDDPV
jgi:hypothetical protein